MLSLRCPSFSPSSGARQKLQAFLLPRPFDSAPTTLYLPCPMTGSSSRLPKFIAPQVPLLSPEPPEGDGWIHEIKHDGFRTLLRIDPGDVRAFTRVAMTG